MRFLFAHISWMPRYRGGADEKISSTHGWVLENKDAHEKWNFKPVGNKLYGYVPIRGKQIEDAPGEIHIDRLGAAKYDEFVDGITVVWFANHPADPKRAYVVGWYRNARVFRASKSYRNREYRISCDVEDATLLKENDRKFLVPHVRSLVGRSLGYGYGQSSLWYADENSGPYVSDIEIYIDQIDSFVERLDANLVEDVYDAIYDLDDGALGRNEPIKIAYTSHHFIRNQSVRSRVISRANGRCEYCGELGFVRSDGSRYIETHHIISLAKQGPDTLDNVIGLCPKHHRQAHFGKDRENLEAELRAKLLQLRGA